MEAHIEHVPPVDPARTKIDLPIAEVTVLEDRAMVTRRGSVTIGGGRSRLVVLGVAPVLQDVSLRAEVSTGSSRVADIRVRRALRIRQAERPAAMRDLEIEVEALGDRHRESVESSERASHRFLRLWRMMVQGTQEIPADAAWGRVDPNGWRTTFDTLFARGRSERDAALDAHFTAVDQADDLRALVARMAQGARPDVGVATWIELDLVSDAASDAPTSTIEVSVSYVVPNAMWRPLHTAALDGDRLDFTVRGMVWQNTGEDWSNAQIHLSTARSSLEVEPPLLADDLLQVQRRNETVEVEAREVEIQSTGPQETAAASSAVELPGVEDGGEVRILSVPRPVTIASDGRPVSFDLWTTTSEARVERIVVAERLERVVLRCRGTNPDPRPILAGPVELVRDHGAIGWTQTVFVPSGGTLELSFGPDDAMRVARTLRETKDEVDRVDRWRRRDFRVDLYLSNLDLVSRTVLVTERVPVSEVEEVKVTVSDKTTDRPVVDADGLVRWALDLPAGTGRTITLMYQVATAPDVVVG